MADQDLSFKIEAFQSRERPWQFHAEILEMLDRDENGRIEFEAAWAVANEEAYWHSSNMARCCEDARAAVQRLFPKFSAKAVSTLVNAAAYQWR